MCVINPLLISENGTLVIYSTEEINAMNKNYAEKENDFWKRFPNLDIDDIDFLSHWHEFVYCETEEEVKEVLKRINEEKVNEHHKNKKTSFWQKLFGY